MPQGMKNERLSPERPIRKHNDRKPGSARKHSERKRRRMPMRESSGSSSNDDYRRRNRGYPQSTPKPRLIVVTNRLPVSVMATSSKKEKKKQKPKLKISDGGLVSALKNLSGLYDMKWIGWVGSTVDDAAEQNWIRAELAKQNCHPVFLSEEIAEGYYNGFCNNVLWPLFHYIPVPIEGIKLAGKQWVAYCDANVLFSKVVSEVYRDGDVVWIHDYHLMLLPSKLRVLYPNIRIGFFSHVPFPSSEIYRVLPVRKELLEGVLCSNLVGFQTHDYARHFISTCVRALGTAATEKGVKHRGRVTHVQAFPIGITPRKFLDCLETDSVKARLKELQSMYKGQKLILGVDRLDYIKGIPLKLKAIERFFERNPKWIGKLVLLQIAVPSRGAVNEYKKLRRQTHELVGRINGRFGSFDTGVPIHYLDKTVPFDQLCALYRFADSVLITSVRDGMNLVAYEYIVCQKEKHGVLILSEFAGAAQSLGAGCVQVNPWNVNECARAIKYALEMSEKEKKRFHEYAFQHVYTHDTKAWANEFISALSEIDIEEKKKTKDMMGRRLYLSLPAELNMKQVTKEFSTSMQRLIVFGVNGTISNTIRQEGLPLEAFGYIQVAERVKENIASLANDPNTTLVLISSSSRSILEKTFGKTEAWLGAENGFFLSRPLSAEDSDDSDYDGGQRLSVSGSDKKGSRKWLMTQENADLTWKRKVYEVFEYVRERTPNSYIRNQEASIEWHYHEVKDQHFAKMQANELVGHLRSGPLLNTNTEIVDTDSIVRIRHLGVSKGTGAVKIIEQIQRTMVRDAYYYDNTQSTAGIDFILCVGNLTAEDEDLFVMLNSIRFIDQEEHPLADLWENSESAGNVSLARSASCPSMANLQSLGMSASVATGSDQNICDDDEEDDNDDDDDDDRGRGGGGGVPNINRYATTPTMHNRESSLTSLHTVMTQYDEAAAGAGGPTRSRNNSLTKRLPPPSLSRATSSYSSLQHHPVRTGSPRRGVSPFPAPPKLRSSYSSGRSLPPPVLKPRSSSPAASGGDAAVAWESSIPLPTKDLPVVSPEAAVKRGSGFEVKEEERRALSNGEGGLLSQYPGENGGMMTMSTTPKSPSQLHQQFTQMDAAAAAATADNKGGDDDQNTTNHPPRVTTNNTDDDDSSHQIDSHLSTQSSIPPAMSREETSSSLAPPPEMERNIDSLGALGPPRAFNSTMADGRQKGRTMATAPSPPPPSYTAPKRVVPLKNKSHDRAAIIGSPTPSTPINIGLGKEGGYSVGSSKSARMMVSSLEVPALAHHRSSSILMRSPNNRGGGGAATAADKLTRPGSCASLPASIETFSAPTNGGKLMDDGLSDTKEKREHQLFLDSPARPSMIGESSSFGKLADHAEDNAYRERLRTSSDVEEAVPNRPFLSRTDDYAENVPNVSVYTVTVGKHESHAHFYVPGIDDPAALLEKLAESVRAASVRL